MSDEEANTMNTKETSGNKRLIGIDAARGLALIGMFLVHFIPTYNTETLSPTLTGLIFSGRSAALFVILAGVGLAIVAYRHRQRKCSSSSLVKKTLIRAGVIALIGLLLGSLGTPVSVILVNYALLFIIALPFLSASPRTLLITAFSWLGFGSVGYWLIMNATELTYPLLSSPAVADLAQPHIIIADAVFAGYYPILTWGFYLFIGLWLGRVLMMTRDEDKKKKLATKLTIVGAITTTVTLIIHGLVVSFSNIVPSLNETVISTGEEEIIQRLMVGLTDKALFAEPLWFLLATPHSNSPVSLLQGTGSAFLVIGLFLLIAHRWQESRVLSAFTVLGIMPLSLYAWHIVLFYFLAHPNGTVENIGGMVSLIAGAALIVPFSSGKRKAPLEALTAELSGLVKTEKVKKE